MEVGRTTGVCRETKVNQLEDEARGRQLEDEWGDINITAG